MKLPSSVVGIDLGNSSLKAVRLQKKGAEYVLSRAAILPAPLDASVLTEQRLADLIKQLISLVKTSGADVHFTVNSPNSTVRYVELPQISLSDIRSALKLNSATYLRQKFDNYTFDACPLDAEAEAALKESQKQKKDTSGVHGKVKLLVGGLPNTETMLYFHAARRAGIRPGSLQLSPISFINCFEAARPELFHNQAVALLDVGFLSSSLTILDKGKPLLTRSVPTGAKQITEYIAQSTNSDFAKAEATKLADDNLLGEATSKTCVTLIREVRSSINFFEKNSDQPISKVFVTGGSSSSPGVISVLCNEIGSPCENWDATAGLQTELPSEQQEIFTRNKAAFSAAIGTARSFTTLPQLREAALTPPKPVTPPTVPPS